MSEPLFSFGDFERFRKFDQNPSAFIQWSRAMLGYVDQNDEKAVQGALAALMNGIDALLAADELKRRHGVHAGAAIGPILLDILDRLVAIEAKLAQEPAPETPERAHDGMLVVDAIARLNAAQVQP